jgi:hypothetical protein
MKNYLLLAACLFYFSVLSGQIKQTLRLSESKEINSGDVFRLNANMYFSLRSDTSANYLTLHCTCKNIDKTIDTIEFSPYPSKLYSFVSNDKKRFVVFWTTDYEYFPSTIAYYVTGDSLFQIGQLDVFRPCSSCESFEFPVDYIMINTTDKNINIYFLKDILLNQGNTEPILCKPRSFRYQYDIQRKELKIIRGCG